MTRNKIIASTNPVRRYHGYHPWVRRYPIPIYPTIPYYNISPYQRIIPYNPTGTTYGNCDCSISSGYPTTNNCQAGGVPICVDDGCTCFNPLLGNAGCFNERGATC